MWLEKGLIWEVNLLNSEICGGVKDRLDFARCSPISELFYNWNSVSTNFIPITLSHQFCSSVHRNYGESLVSLFPKSSLEMTCNKMTDTPWLEIRRVSLRGCYQLVAPHTGKWQRTERRAARSVLYTKLSLLLSTTHSRCLKIRYPGEDPHYLIPPGRATTAYGWPMPLKENQVPYLVSVPYLLISAK